MKGARNRSFSTQAVDFSMLMEKVHSVQSVPERMP